jgi:hypothetical protein
LMKQSKQLMLTKIKLKVNYFNFKRYTIEKAETAWNDVNKDDLKSNFIKFS